MAFFIGDNCWVDHPLTTLMINFKETIHDNFETYSDETWKCKPKVIAHLKVYGNPVGGFLGEQQMCGRGSGYNFNYQCTKYVDATNKAGFYWDGLSSGFEWCWSEQRNCAAACSGCICHFWNSMTSTGNNGAFFFEPICNHKTQYVNSSGCGTIRGDYHGSQLLDRYNGAWMVGICLHSDYRLKDNITLLQEEKAGIPNIYSFNYKWDTKTTWTGVIAQELLDTGYSDAVGVDSEGFYYVNYSRLGAKQ